MTNKKIKIIVDSTSDLPEELVKKYDIDIVPMYIHYDDQIYKDRTQITSDEFYDILRDIDELPTTSAPNPRDFWERVTESLKEYSTIFIATISSTLSASYQSAGIVIKRMKNKKIHLVDSKYGSGVLAFLALAAAKLFKKGLTGKELVEEVERIRDESVLVGYVDNVENLKKSGRISHLKYFLGTLLKAKPIIEVKNGLLEGIGKATGKVKAQEKVVEEVIFRIPKDKKYDLMITHGDDIESAEKIMSELEKELTLGEKIINFLTPALAVHLGIGSIVVSLSPSVS
ncbi:MAG: DegV family protein [Candidatus Heimdallarchaeota archaeon]|nr:DegV family protein [Candidatus Heimdallarchaeota archaeon]MCK4769466.1 DegV family protein [Candidatus Heimdallarchaeota archaeon]